MQLLTLKFLDSTLSPDPFFVDATHSFDLEIQPIVFLLLPSTFVGLLRLNMVGPGQYISCYACWGSS